MPLQKRRSPFDHPTWIFELKYDGFRALALIENGRAQLVSRNDNTFASFTDLAEDIADTLVKWLEIPFSEVCRRIGGRKHSQTTCLKTCGVTRSFTTVAISKDRHARIIIMRTENILH
jgi:hypothetical protein